ncbi:MAG TPA: hypothetical protein VE572_00840 [Nitrososphaeraceae archaeon]|jgi:hypothetical protein|nr:hypothetical protein [Nitrososphaeraceae archaeon]
MTKRALCEWCNERPGDYDLSPADVEYATMICDQCFAKNFYEYGRETWAALGGVIDDEMKGKEELK